MSLQDFSYLAAIAQAVLVIISLFFIWYQLREGQKLARAANSQALSEQAAAFNGLLYQNAELLKLWYTYGKSIEKATEVDRLRYREMLTQWLIFHENIHYQWRKKLLDTEMYSAWRIDLEATVKHHNLEALATNVERLFPGEFGKLVADLRANALKSAM